MNVETAINGIADFFDGEYFCIGKVFDVGSVYGQKQTEECMPTFDHCFVNQDGGGYTGDDFHGVVYFHIGNEKYISVQY